jgi:hypothetical protein
MTTTDRPARAGMMTVTRSRGLLSGVLLVLLGLWGALIPFVGPLFNYAYTPATAWTWTSGRLWLEVLPGIAAVVSGLVLAVTANRAVGVLAAWLGVLSGAWFLAGPVLGRLWNGPQGAAGTPTGSTTRQVLEQIGFFTGLGAVILFLAATALGRFLVRSVRDVAAADRRRERHETRDETRDDDRDDRTGIRGDAEPAGTGRRTAFAGNRAVERTDPPTREIPVHETPAATGTSSGAGATRVER